MYITVKNKLWISLSFACAWMLGSVWLALPWIQDLSDIFNPFVAWFIVIGIAIVPGFANAFIIPALLLDKRPGYPIPDILPDITILIAAYNEGSTISDTITSILKQNYPGHVHVIIYDDGSTDNTEQAVISHVKSFTNADNFTLHYRQMPANLGKSKALNMGLKLIRTKLFITIDADTYLYKDALKYLVTNIVCGPPNTAAVAGTIVVRNSRKNFLTKLQEWDFFQGIAVVKRTQSLLQGTLVAQGAFSIYETAIIKENGGWCNKSVGEDIVLTWALRAEGHRVGYAERAFAFTNVPETYRQFFKQRERWSRGLIEAFKTYPAVLLDIRPNTPFIYINLLFPYTDLVFVTAFMPGMIAAIFFQWYGVVGIMTLILLPLAIIMNWIMFIKQRKIFIDNGLAIRKHFAGFVVYMLFYQLIMIPATITGYWKEILKIGNKNWGTK